MELMIAVVVAGILAAVAYPNLTSMIKRSRRADAIAGLTAIMQAQERYRSNHPTYTDTVTTVVPNVDIAYKHYDFALTPGEGGYAAGYTVTATPKSTSTQATDNDCATLGVKLQGSMFSYLATKSDGTDNAEVVKHCWSR